MYFKIYGIRLVGDYAGIELASEPEYIDCARDAENAVRLASEYQDAYGDGWRIWLVDLSDD